MLAHILSRFKKLFDGYSIWRDSGEQT